MNVVKDVGFFVVADDSGKHRIWPAFATAPTGWRVVYGEATCVACLDFIDQTQWAAKGERTELESALGSP